MKKLTSHQKRLTRYLVLLASLGFMAPYNVSFAADDITVNQHLDYNSDSNDGPLFNSKNSDVGIRDGIPNYVIMFSDTCYNSKRQAKRTAELYDEFKGRVAFVTINVDRSAPLSQAPIVREHYKGSFPHLVILDRHGKTVYDRAGEISTDTLRTILNGALSAK
jgi:hypothetical protein